MKASVTGANGFIGRHLCKKLVKKGYEVKALVRSEHHLKELKELGIDIIICDLANRDSLKGSLEGCQYLFHLANISRWWLKNKNLYNEINVKGTRYILKEALESGVSKVIYTSSVAAIRQPPGVFSREDLEHCGNFESHYEESKFLAERAVLDFYEKTGLSSVILNPGVVIGPEDFKTFGNMLIDFLNNKLEYRVFDNSYVPLVYIDDVVEAHILAAERGKPGEKYIIVGENAKIIDIFETAGRINGKPIPRYQIPCLVLKLLAYIYEFKSMLDGKYPKLAVDAVRAMQLGASASNAKAKRELGIQFTSVESAVDKTIKWYKENGYVKN